MDSVEGHVEGFAVLLVSTYNCLVIVLQIKKKNEVPILVYYLDTELDCLYTCLSVLPPFYQTVAVVLLNMFRTTHE